MIPYQMIAVTVRGDGRSADSLHAGEVDTPSLKPGEILVRVRAAGVNRPDVLQRRGLYPPPPGAPETLGLEIAGEVAAVADGATRWAHGDRVTALLPGGGYAEYAAVDARHALPIPDGVSFEQAAALPETVFTVWANVFEAGALKPGETLLVHGATSGIGVTAIQMAKAAGARVIATGRGPGKATAALEQGADLAINTAAEDFAAEVQADGGADVILDMVGGDYVQRNLQVLKPGGRLVQIAFQAGHRVELDLRPIMMKRLVLTGSTLRPRSADEKARLARAVEETVWPWLADGRVRPPVARTFPLSEAAAAHAELEANRHVGKIVLVP
ncbi:MAG TPA: NAD(P)H-quinone oxidoreductase [Caulobacteraceae bacterium]|jgi:putative PIG3 family NAD(P)H quinone oxidoreductase